MAAYAQDHRSLQFICKKC